MTDKLFLIDQATQSGFTYTNLFNDLQDVSQVNFYCHSKAFYAVFLHVISALLHKVDLVLLDSDFSEAELNNMQVTQGDLLIKQEVRPLRISDYADLKDKLQANQDWNLTLFTSGTTGIPKKVVHTFKSLSRAVRISEKHQDDVWGFAYNPTHMAGLQVFFQALLNGNSIINLFESPRNEVLASINEFGITNISATPTFFRMLLPLNDVYPSVRKLTSGGEKFDVKLSDQLLQAFPNAKLRNVYASTEAGTILESREDTFTIKDDSLCKIIDNELYINSALLGKGKELETPEDWYATGDLVEIIESHPLRFRFLQRKNEMINVGGYKVNPQEVEEVLQSHPSIRQAYVYGKANPILGNILMADVVLSDIINEKELRDFLTPLLQPFKIPRMVNYVETIELTRSGKLKRT